MALTLIDLEAALLAHRDEIKRLFKEQRMWMSQELNHAKIEPIFGHDHSQQSLNRKGSNIGKKYSYTISKENSFVEGDMVVMDSNATTSFAKSSGWRKRDSARAMEALEHAATNPEVLISVLNNNSSKQVIKNSALDRFVDSPYFETLSCLGIILYSIFLGVEVEHGIYYEEPMIVFFWFNIVFNVAFTVELLLRVRVWGLRHLFCKRNADLKWNWIDLMSVVIGISLVSVDTFSPESQSKNSFFLRCARVLRTVRALRLLRLIRAFKELRVLVTSVITCCKSLIWALILLAINVYFFVVILTQGVSDSFRTNEDIPEETKELTLHLFGSSWRSAFTLLACIFGGTDFLRIFFSLQHVGIAYVALFQFFIAMTMLAILNVITGMFVQNSLANAQDDVQDLIQAQLASESSAVMRLHSLFVEADIDGDGKLTTKEFQEYLRSDPVVAYLRHMDLNTCKVEGFFELLDLDNNGTLSSEEFCLGCLRLQGGAKNVDLHSMMYEQKRLTNWMRKQFVNIGIVHEEIQNALGVIQQSVCPPRVSDHEDKMATFSESESDV